MEKFALETFIKQHNLQYKNYFEAVISPEGIVEYAIPSHVYKLEMIWGVPYEELYEGGSHRDALMKKMPLTASPLHWLVDTKGYVAAWYDNFVCPLNITSTQISTIAQLLKAGCMYSQTRFEVTVEARRERCFKNNVCDVDALEKLMYKRSKKQQEIAQRLRIE